MLLCSFMPKNSVDVSRQCLIDVIVLSFLCSLSLVFLPHIHITSHPSAAVVEQQCEESKKRERTPNERNNVRVRQGGEQKKILQTLNFLFFFFVFCCCSYYYFYFVSRFFSLATSKLNHLWRDRVRKKLAKKMWILNRSTLCEQFNDLKQFFKHSKL